MAVMAGAGGASIISRSLGAGDLERARKAFGTTVSFASGIGILVSVFVLLFLEQVLRLFGATEAILPHAEAYLSVILFGIPLQMFAMVGNHAARAEGRARIAMTTLLISAILNIILDPIFIFGLGWGMRGAAVATVLSQMVMFLWIFGYFYRGKSALSFVREYLVPSPRLLREIVAVGSSEFVRMAAGSFSIVLINGALVHWGGDLHVAVYGVINRALSFFFMPLMGIAQGFQPILGYNYGAGNLDRARRVIRLAVTASTALALIGFTAAQVFPRRSSGCFRRPGPYRRGVRAMSLISMAFFLIGFQITGSAMFQALEKPVLPFFSPSRGRCSCSFPSCLSFRGSWGPRGSGSPSPWRTAVPFC
jgi:putative MATE family efflux protein